MSHNAQNSAHSSRWKGPRSRGLRLTSKLGRGRVSLKRLAQLLDTSHLGKVVITMDDEEKKDTAPDEPAEKPAEEKTGEEAP